MWVAQTNLQLYNQLREDGFPLPALVAVHRAYDALAELYAGFYQGDGKPFVAHGVGVASIVAAIGQPAEIVVVGLLHNVYGNADFGDGLDETVTPSRRRIIREAVGERVEELLGRFRHLRINRRTVADIRSALPRLDETDRRLLLVDIADHLEKYVDLGVLYYGESDWLHESTGHIAGDLVEIAREIGEPRLGEMLAEALEDAAEAAAGVPAELRASDGRRWLKLVVPRSCQLRPSLTLQDGRPARPEP
jgi:(p)ppGpp synthase/HD superfamily hydrolase